MTAFTERLAHLRATFNAGQATGLEAAELTELEAIEAVHGSEAGPQLDALAARARSNVEGRARARAAASNPRAAERVDNRTAGYGKPLPGDSRADNAYLAAWFGRDGDARAAGGPLEAVSRARRTVEALHRRGDFHDQAAETLETMLTERRGEEKWRAAELVTTLSSDTYSRAFSKVINDPQSGHLYLSEQERDALARGRALAIGTGPTGGFAVPLQLDPSLMLTSDGTISKVRQLARVERGIAKEFDLVSSQGVTVEWAAEGQEASDNSPTLAQPFVKSVRQQSFVPFSVELDSSWSNAQAQIRAALTDAADIEDARVLVNGAGGDPPTQPQGIVTALTGTASEITTAAAGTLTLDDLETVQSALPPRFRPRAQVIANLAVIQAARRMEVVTGVSAVQGSGSNLSLLGDSLSEESQLDGTIAAGKHVLVTGDWRHLVVYEQIPSLIELVPHLFGPARRMPTGQRGLFMIRFWGATVAVPEAFRLLTVHA